MVQKKKANIQDIAQQANVSISTVSRVLNNAAAVTEAKREAVLRAVAELNYQPNVAAQALAGGQTKTIGVITQDISNPFYDAILRGVRQGFEGSGFYPIFADGRWQAAKEEKAILTLMARRVDALIILGGCSPEEALQQWGDQVPLLVIGRDLSSLDNQCLPLDDFAGAYKATQYLIELGHQRIAHITGILSHHDAVERRNGYEQALADAGLEPDPDLIIEGDFLEQSGVLAVEMLFTHARPFSAVFAANDQIACGVLLGLYRRGIRVPDDVSIIGFDDQRMSAYTTPPLTTIRQPAIEIGQTAAQAILHLLKDKPFEIPAFPAELIIRESVARYRY
ncbi:MAG: LacI family DNA-binding transcriptional regulator [Anaerolineae bacterium]|nr:LacI family DNA-binding transcriptional regulator [Anaerolineae bacterium]